MKFALFHASLHNNELILLCAFLLIKGKVYKKILSLTDSHNWFLIYYLIWIKKILWTGGYESASHYFLVTQFLYFLKCSMNSISMVWFICSVVYQLLIAHLISNLIHLQMFNCNHNYVSSITFLKFHHFVVPNRLFAQLYDIKHSYQIWIIFKQIYLAHRWNPNPYLKVMVIKKYSTLPKVPKWETHFMFKILFTKVAWISCEIT